VWRVLLNWQKRGLRGNTTGHLVDAITTDLWNSRCTKEKVQKKAASQATMEDGYRVCFLECRATAQPRKAAAASLGSIPSTFVR
jgi:hypothetical protein